MAKDYFELKASENQQEQRKGLLCTPLIWLNTELSEKNLIAINPPLRQAYYTTEEVWTSVITDEKFRRKMCISRPYYNKSHLP